MATLTLLPSQEEHANRLRCILRARAVALDLSMLGAGKTFTASHLALDASLGFRHAIVVAPLSVRPKWLDMARTFGVPIRDVISFCALRSTRCRQPKHGLLQRRDRTVRIMADDVPTHIDKVDFAASSDYLRLVSEGVLLVIDEVQNIKNVSAQFRACRALIGPIVDAFTAAASPECAPSRALLLSGSPVDRKEQIVTLLRTMHVMKSDELSAYNLGAGRLEWRGLKEIQEHCLTLDAGTVTRMLGDVTCVAPDAAEHCYALFQEVIKPAYASAMPVPETTSRITKVNAFHEIHGERDRELLSQAVGALTRVVMGNSGAEGGVGATRRSQGLMAFRGVTLAMRQIETAKIGTFSRLARACLMKEPHRKVVICVGFGATVRDLCTDLADFRPLVVTGRTSVRDRGRRLERFQRADDICRLLIGNLTACSTGIDLDDKDGRFPRTALVSPNPITLYQFGHRFHRAGSRSDADVRFVYGKHAAEENVLAVMYSKSCTNIETTEDQAAAGVVSSGDHGAYIESADQGAGV